MKKQIIISILLCSILILTIFATAVSADTSFKGVNNGDSTFTFDRSTFVTGIQLPEGSDFTQEVRCTNTGSLSFTISAPGYAVNGKGKIRFELPLEVLDINEVSWHDVVLYQGNTKLTTYLYGRTDEIAIYEADITSPGSFNVKFELGVSQSLPIKADLTKYLEPDKEQKSDEKPKTVPASSPLPVIGLLLGIGAAVIAVSRKQ